MPIQEYIQREFEKLQQRHATEIRELAVRCAEVCENDGYREGQKDGANEVRDLLPAVWEVFRCAVNLVEGNDDFESLCRSVEHWRQTRNPSIQKTTYDL